MSETTPPASTDPATPAAKPKKKRRWLKILLGLFVFLILVVLLAPMLLSTGPAKNMIVSQINKNLNGKLEIGSWSLGWTSGIHVKDVKVFDDTNAQIAQIRSFDTPMSLISAARGNIDLGKTTLDGVTFDAKRYPDGQINFVKLAKTDPDAKKTDTPSPTKRDGDKKPTPAGEPIKLPNIKGEFIATNVSGKFEDQTLGQTVAISDLAATIKIPDINQPIEHAVDVALSVGGGAPGKISIKGTADAVNNNVLDLNTANVNDTVSIQSVDIASLAPFLPPSVGVELKRGTTNGTFVLAVVDGKAATFSGNLDGKDIQVAGKALKGDQYETKSFVVTIPPTAVAMPNGPTDLDTMTIKTGGEKIAPITVTWDQGNLTASADAAISALKNAGGKLAANTGGVVDVQLDVNVGKLASMLPNTFKVVEGTTLSSGQFHQGLKIVLYTNTTDITAETKLTGVAGTKDGKPVTLSDINTILTAQLVPAGGKLPELRNLVLDLTTGSKFAAAHFEAPTLAKLTGNASANLEQLQKEVGQIFDFGKTNLAGTFALLVNTTGDATDLTKPATLNATATLSGLNITGEREVPPAVVGGQPTKEPFALQQKWVELKLADAQVVKDGAGQSIRNALVTIKTNDPNAPTIDVEIGDIVAVITEARTSAEWNIRKLNANVPQLQQQFASAVPALKNAQPLSVGTVSVVGKGAFTQTQQGQTATLTGLGVKETNNLFSVDQKSEQVTITIDSAGQMQPAGLLAIAADLPGLNKVVQQLSAGKQEIDASQPNVQSGKLAGTIELASADATKMTVTVAMAANDLSITTAGGTSDRQTIQFGLKATPAADFSSINDTSAYLKSTFADVNLSNVSVDLPKTPEGSKGTALPVVKNLDLVLAIADMGPLDSLMQAFTPRPAPSKDPKKPADEPIRIPRGAVKMSANVKQAGQTTTVTVSELSGDKELRLQKGEAKYKVQPFNVTLEATADIANDPNKPLAEQLKQIAVNKLNGQLGIATLEMPERIVLTAPLSSSPVAAGSVKIAGKLQDVTTLLETLDGKKPGELYPYLGEYVAVQKISTKGNVITPAGTIDITNFQVLQDGKPIVTEPRIAIANNLDLDMTAKNATINTLSIDMAESKALNIKITGALADWETKRQITKNFFVDLNYSLEKLWPIIKPMVPPDSQDMVKDLMVQGTFRRTFNVGGSFPGNVPFTQGIKSLYADGSFAVERLQWQGCDIRGIERPFVLKDGLFRTIVPGQEAKPGSNPFAMNGGQVDISNFTIDLTQDPPRLTTPKDHKLVVNVSLTPALSDRFGKMINNPLFVNPKEASGVMDVTMVQCDNLPLGELVTKPVAENNGSANISYSIKGVHVGNELVVQLLKLAGEKEFANSMQGDISEAKVSIANGQVQQDTTITIGEQKRPLRFAGGVSMADSVLRDFRVNLPSSMLKQFGSDLARYLPEGFNIPLDGQVTSPRLNAGNLISDAIRQATQKAALDALTGGGRKDAQPANPNQPDNAQPENKDDPIGNIFDALKKKQEDDKRKKDEKKKK